MEQDSGNVVANASERDIIANATCDFTANDNKPWEVSIEKGTSLKVLESKKKWWKVENNGRIGYAPAKCLKLVYPENQMHSNVEKKNSIETDHEENGCKSEEHESAGITDKKSPGTDFVETSERRRSSRLAKNPTLIPRKKSRQDSSWTTALERNQQQNKTSAELFKTHSKTGRALVGPRDLLVAPGLREKVSIFPDIPNPVKNEKVEPPDYESDHSESSQIAFSCTTDTVSSFPVQQSSVASIEEIAVELETVIVKNEIDFDNSSSELLSDKTDEFECGPSIYSVFSSAAANQEEVSPVQLSSLEHTVTDVDAVCFPSTSTPELIATSDPTTSLLPTTAKALSLECSRPVGQPLIRPDPIPLDNSSNPCCLLFHKVWAIVGLRYDPVPLNSEINTPPNIVLALRLVCQDWRAGVDKFYENLSESIDDEDFQVILRKHKNYNCSQMFVPTPWRAYEFDINNDSIIRFLSHFQHTHYAHGPMSVQRQKSKNPILGRKVSFRGGIRDNTEWAKGESMMAELLGKYGRHIWYCMIHIDEVKRDTTRHIGNVNNWLQFMPNLKHLTWKSETRMLANVEAPQKLPKLITQSEWPKMKHLNRVNFGSFSVANEIHHAFLMKNCHISTLVTDILPHQPVVLLNLKELSLKIYSQLMFESFEMSFHHWPLLERIQLFLWTGFSGISSERAFKVLQLWKNTLTHVSIQLCRHKPGIFPSNSDYDIDGSGFRRLPYRLDLPRVKYFKMNLSRDVTLLQDASLDFLFPLRASLEHLHLEYRTVFSYGDQVTYDKDVTWTLPSNKQLPFSFHYGSNIWNVFIKLKKVYVRSGNQPGNENFRVHTYCREEWFSKRHTTPKVKRPNISFEVGKCFHFPSTTRDEQYELAVKSLMFAWRNLNDLNEGDWPEREKMLKQQFTISIQEYVKEGIFPNWLSYGLNTGLKNKFCELCRDRPLRNAEHFTKCHFLYGGVYNCDFAGCVESFVSKFDVVQHRMSHGKKHMGVYYELEAVPKINFPSEAFKHIFNWIQSDKPDHLRLRRNLQDF